MTGIEVTRRLRSGPHVPYIVILTFQKGAAYREASLKAGADGFISKEDLVSELPQVLAAVRNLAVAPSTS
jgi:DNA-binding NarL/FixJ family response regulator